MALFAGTFTIQFLKIMIIFINRGLLNIFLLVLFLREKCLQIILLFYIFTHNKVFILIFLEMNEVCLLVAWNNHCQIKITQWVQKQDLLRRIVFEIKIV